MMDPQKSYKVLLNILSVLVLIIFIVLSLIVQIRDAAMDSTSLRERQELRERLDRADRERDELKRAIEVR